MEWANPQAMIIAILSILTFASAWGALHNRLKNLEDWRTSHEVIAQQNLIIIQQMRENLKELSTLATIYIPKINALERIKDD